WKYLNDYAGEFIVCSPIYNQGRVFIVDHFSIVCLDSKTGSTIWSTYLGYELYVSPTYSDEKLYVVTDQRSVHVLNATNGEQLSIFHTGSNSWSSPTIYEGRVYVGNNDWNVYCFADHQATISNISLELNSSQFSLGETILGFGQLNPRFPNQSIILSFQKPEGTIDKLISTTSKNGYFNFSYEPELIGDWIINTNWISEKSYYTSAKGDPIQISVGSANQLDSIDETMLSLILIIILVIVIGIIILFKKRRNKNSKPI
ncbi:hypothetical protein E2P47_01095, partial [Candidatus Bathyarchaeota archaeon]